MRIIGGLHKGRKIKSTKGAVTRPTTDFVREALFNIIGNDVIESCFLDIFAGTGAVGLEALSRGAKNAIFVEKNALACSVIKQNLQQLDLTEKALVIQNDAVTVLTNLDLGANAFNIFFLDPPYYKNQIEVGLKAIRNLKMANSIIVVQHPKDESFSFKGFLCYKQKVYGKTVLTFLKRSD
ncbi:MAG: 16S rRNA (guanine(966)-N(2))-methyltransferase RsmD [Tepidanaerobacteraceae bacterium]|nr:16S rRNA (guanine(966)-N(2))-methyltransferase RsmD [Tepidanaerobacteraceae bacterium]